LRVWERRYGFPRPERHGGNRRVYTDADVQRLRLVARAVERGYRPGDVIDKSEHELTALLGESAPASGPLPGVEDILTALRNDQTDRVDSALRLASAALGPQRFVTELAHPLALAVGDAWANGELGIRHEHLLSEYLTTQLRRVLSELQASLGRPLVLLTTLPGESHALVLQMVALYLATCGASARLLGAETPVPELIDAARALHADVVGLSITATPKPDLVRQQLRTLRRGLTPRTALWLGGSGSFTLERLPPKTQRFGTWEELAAVLLDARVA
jgi:DNA-binding transcriptional MerR regulator